MTFEVGTDPSPLDPHAPWGTHGKDSSNQAPQDRCGDP